MTQQQIRIAAQRIFEMRLSRPAAKADATKQERIAVRRKLEAVRFQKLLARMEKDSALTA
jgi:hypothetical protein